MQDLISTIMPSFYAELLDIAYIWAPRTPSGFDGLFTKNITRHSFLSEGEVSLNSCHHAHQKVEALQPKQYAYFRYWFTFLRTDTYPLYPGSFEDYVLFSEGERWKESIPCRVNGYGMYFVSETRYIYIPLHLWPLGREDFGYWNHVFCFYLYTAYMNVGGGAFNVTCFFSMGTCFFWFNSERSI